MTNNLIPDRFDSWGITSNGSEKEIALWARNLSDSDFKDIQINSIYNTLILRADFKCLLSNYRIKNGNYGLRIRLKFRSTSDNSTPIYRWLSLDSSEMFGNPYSFLVYSTQEASFDIAEMGPIEGIGLYLYQEDNFEYYQDTGYAARIEPPDFDNILVKNIYLSFGSDLTKIEDNTLQIYTGDSLTYNETNATDNSREMGLIWYNKDEDNTYIGFSDGIYDPTYDEIDYLDKSKVDSRLMSQMGKDIPDDKNALEISADLEDAQPIFKNLRNALTRDLRNNLYAFQDQIKSLTKYKDSFATLLSNISDTGEILETLQETMNTEYVAILSAAKQIQSGTVVAKPAQTVVIGKTDDRIKISVEAKVTAVTDTVTTLLTEIQTDIKTNYSGFMSVYDTYETRIQKVLTTIDTYIKQLIFLLDDDTAKMTAFFRAGYIFEPYGKTDFSNYDNKYCIYWYRYEPGYVDANELFMEKGWHRLTGENVQNLGLPKERLSEDSIYNAKKVLSPEGILERNLDTQYTEEKYIAILFYNHTMYKSNIITFINENPPIDDKIVDSSDACKIEHSENSQPSYQTYGLNNLLVNAADGYRKRKLLLRYDGKTAGDEALYGAQIFWYVPKNATMLKYELKDFSADWSNDEKADPDIEFPYSKPGYVCFYRTIGGTEKKQMIDGVEKITYEINNDDRCFVYRIKDYYSQTFTNNTIHCRIVKANHYDYNAEISFIFSSFGTSGTDYTLVISPTGEKPAVDADGLILGISLYDYNNERMFLLDSAPAVDNLDPYLEPLTFEGPSGYGVGIHEYKDGKNDYGVETLVATKVQDCYYGVLKATVPYTIDELGKIINLNTYYPIPYTAGNYYIEGPSVVVYESDGNKPTYYKNPFKIFYRYTDKAKGETADVEKTNVKWSMVYYNEQGYEMDAEKWAKPEYAALQGFMPKLNDQNGLTPCNMYLENTGSANVYPVVLCQDDQQTVLWAQPIYCMKNRYASAMLNKWDGSFKIDEENGTILSTMVGAGRKNANNQFEGILMGDVGSASEDNATGVGLYGFHNGAQSFNFNVDGTAFIGKSGRGRIQFNGDKGTITSASYEQAKESAGMMIDLDDGVIDMRGAKLDETSGKYVADTSSNVHIDVKSPYFKIDSVKGNTLMFVGGEKEGYYLQSDEYKETKFTLNETESNGLKTESTDTTGTGMKLDLKAGTLDAFDFYLTSKNVMLNSKDSSKPYFVIKDNCNNMLMHIGGTKFWLKSADYSETAAGEPEAGMKIDLTTGKIDAFNFSLVSSKVKLSTSGTEAKPYLEIVGEDITLMHISEAGQYIRSNTFVREAVGTTGKGMEINLGTGEFTAYTFNLKAGNASTGQLRIDSSAAEYPLWIGTIDKTYDPENDDPEDIIPNFKVDWAGNFYSQGGKFTGAIHATSGTLGSLTVTGVLDGGTISGATIEGGVLKVGPTVGETGYQLYATDKEVTIQNAKIINCDIQSGDGAPTGTGGFSVTPGGIMKGFGCQLTNGQFTTCTVFDSLTIGGTKADGTSGAGNIMLSGQNKICFNSDSSYMWFYANRVSLSPSTVFYAPEINAYEAVLGTVYGAANETAGISYNEYVKMGSGLKVMPGKSFVCGEINSRANLCYLYANDLKMVEPDIFYNSSWVKLTELIKQVAKDMLSSATVSLSGTGVTDNGNNTASVSLSYSGTTPDAWLGWDTSSTGRIYSTEYGTDSDSASGRTYYTKADGQSYSGTVKTTVTATINIPE